MARTRSQFSSLALVAVLSTTLLGANCKPKDAPAPLGGDSKLAVETATPRPPDEGLTAEEAARLLPGIETASLTPKQRADLNDIANDTFCPCASLTLAGCLREKVVCPVAPRMLELSKKFLSAGVPQATALMRVETYYGSFSKERRKEVGTAGAVLGAPKAPITIVEFSDFQCPACRAAHPALEQLVEKFHKEVRWNFRHFPLPQHENAAKAAQCAVYADQHGKFWPLADKMFAHQDQLDDAGLARFAKEVGLDGEAMLKAVSTSDQFAALVEKDKAAGTELAIGGTPSLFINGRQYVGLPNTLEFLSWTIEDELNWMANGSTWEPSSGKPSPAEAKPAEAKPNAPPAK